MASGTALSPRSFCSNCGNPLAPTAKFCEGCGTMLSSSPPPLQSFPSASSPPPLPSFPSENTAGVGDGKAELHLKRAWGFITEVEKATAAFRDQAIRHDAQIDDDQPFLAGIGQYREGRRQIATTEGFTRFRSPACNSGS